MAPRPDRVRRRRLSRGKAEQRRRTHARRVCRQVETLVRAVVGDEVSCGTRLRIDRDRRDVVARLLGYDPNRMVGLFIVTDGDP